MLRVDEGIEAWPLQTTWKGGVSWVVFRTSMKLFLAAIDRKYVFHLRVGPELDHGIPDRDNRIMIWPDILRQFIRYWSKTIFAMMLFMKLFSICIKMHKDMIYHVSWSRIKLSQFLQGILLTRKRYQISDFRTGTVWKIRTWSFSISASIKGHPEKKTCWLKQFILMTCRSLNLNMCCLWWATSAFELSIWGVPFRSRSSESEKFPYQMIQNLAMILILMFDGLIDVGWTERNADGSQLWEPFMLADEHQPIKAWLKGHAEDNIIVTKSKPYPTRHVTYYIYTSC